MWQLTWLSALMINNQNTFCNAHLVIKSTRSIKSHHPFVTLQDFVILFKEVFFKLSINQASQSMEPECMSKNTTHSIFM